MDGVKELGHGFHVSCEKEDIRLFRQLQAGGRLSKTVRLRSIEANIFYQFDTKCKFLERKNHEKNKEHFVVDGVVSGWFATDGLLQLP